MLDYSFTLGNAVKMARKELGLTQSEVANLIHVDVRTVLNIENHRGNPKMEVLYPLIRALHIDPFAVFYPEQREDAPFLRRLQALINDCSENEAKVLHATLLAVLEVLRAGDNEEIK